MEASDQIEISFKRDGVRGRLVIPRTPNRGCQPAITVQFNSRTSLDEAMDAYDWVSASLIRPYGIMALRAEEERR